MWTQNSRLHFYEFTHFAVRLGWVITLCSAFGKNNVDSNNSDILRSDLCGITFLWIESIHFMCFMHIVLYIKA